MLGAGVSRNGPLSHELRARALRTAGVEEDLRAALAGIKDIWATLFSNEEADDRSERGARRGQGRARGGEQSGGMDRKGGTGERQG